MIPLLLTMALSSICQSNAELAIQHVQSDRPALGRYYASLAALEILPQAASLGEGHVVSWVYLPNQPLQPLLVEQTPRWGRIVRFGIAAGRMLWKAQLYASTAESRSTMADMLRRQRLGAAYKTGDHDQFDAFMDHRGDILLYQLQPPTGTLIRTTFKFGQPEATESFRAASSEALRRLGFP